MSEFDMNQSEYMMMMGFSRCTSPYVNHNILKSANIKNVNGETPEAF
jgi:hypothetical protein